ncbi:MAG: hypothetical protein NC191_06325 [Muribaculaceae bacterium]|nr:hypothetical protein [Muribaculaceae bacterium]
MAHIGDLISSLQVGAKKFSNPEWWATTHKLKKEMKNDLLCKANASFNCSYKVNTADSFTSAQNSLDSMLMAFESPKNSDYAPWNPVLRPYKQLIIFKKKK